MPPRVRCIHNYRIAGDQRYDCLRPVVRGKMYCEEHLSEAMTRVEIVRDDRPKPWPGVPRETNWRQRFS